MVIPCSKYDPAATSTVSAAQAESMAAPIVGASPVLSGNMYQTHEEILEKTAMFIAAFHSHLERKGKMVELDTLPEDWAIGSPYLNEKSRANIDPYIKLFGEEKGALRPL